VPRHHPDAEEEVVARPALTMANEATIRALLENAIDYAGLFPPAGLELPAVVRRYAEYRAGPDAWALGRLVVPATRLGELSEAASPLLPRAQGSDATVAPWHIAALHGDDPEVDLALVAGFNDRHRRDSDNGHAVVDVVELKVAEVEAIPAALQPIPDWIRGRFVELPPGADFRRAATLLREHGAGAKLRTGGITPGAFPSPETIAAFLQACVAAGIPCKVTAGLHHALAGDYPYTYDGDSARGAMYGFVPVLLAGALARAGASTGTMVALLRERASSAFAVDAQGLRWREERVPSDELGASRTSLVASFGSCSFEEPLAELRALGWL
jgi:hypothetical protein